MKSFLRYHLPAILYAALIIAASSIPYLKTPKIITLQFDKIVHFLEYALLAFLAYRSCSHLGRLLTPHKALLLSTVLVAGFAVLDEFHQRSVPGRDSGIGDLAMDLAGAALVLILLWYREKSRKRVISGT